MHVLFYHLQQQQHHDERRKARNTFTVMGSTATLHYQMEFLHLSLSLHHLGNDFTKRHLNIFHVRALTAAVIHEESVLTVLRARSFTVHLIHALQGVY